jgi:hypothetical protein
MSLQPSQVQDLSIYQQLLGTLVNILDKESTIASADRQLTPTNITAVNASVTKVLTAIDTITTPSAP